MTIRQLARFVIVLWVALMLVLAATSYTLPGAGLDFDGLLAAALCWVIVGGVISIKVPSNLVGPLAMVAPPGPSVNSARSLRYDVERVVEGFVGSSQVQTGLDEDTMSPSIVGVWVKQR